MAKTRTKRKTRKGGDYGMRFLKTWQNNFDNCKKQKKEDYDCRITMLRNDYHGDGSWETWGPKTRSSASRMWAPIPNNPQNHTVIKGPYSMVKTETMGSFDAADL